MMTREADKKREQTMFFCTDDLVPQDHLLMADRRHHGLQLYCSITKTTD